MGKRPNVGGMGMGNMQGLIKQAKKISEFLGVSYDDIFFAQ